jgi:hypothetical protein
MKDALKKFVDENRPAFDDQETTEQAWHSIEASLPKRKQIPLWDSIGIWRAAAALLVGLCVYFFVTRNSAPYQHAQLAAIQGQRDFTDLESYYHNQITEKISLINDYDASGEKEQFTQDFQKLDAMYQVLSEEMKSRPSEKVKDALVLNLLVRIDLLNQQLKKLEDSKKRKAEKSA